MQTSFYPQQNKLTTDHPKTMASQKNPYQTPTYNEQAIEPANSYLTAITIGFAIALGFSLGTTNLITLAYYWILTTQGVAPQDLFRYTLQSQAYLATFHILGFLTIIPGGFWAARLGQSRQMSNAAFTGLLYSIYVILGSIAPFPIPIPRWSFLLSIVIPLVACITGGAIYQRTCQPGSIETLP